MLIEKCISYLTGLINFHFDLVSLVQCHVSSMIRFKMF